MEAKDKQRADRDDFEKIIFYTIGFQRNKTTTGCQNSLLGTSLELISIGKLLLEWLVMIRKDVVKIRWNISTILSLEIVRRMVVRRDTEDSK